MRTTVKQDMIEILRFIAESPMKPYPIGNQTTYHGLFEPSTCKLANHAMVILDLVDDGVIRMAQNYLGYEL